MTEYFTSKELANANPTSSKGNQLKWRKNDYWYKADKCGYEALAEYMVSHLLQKSNAQVVSYELTPIVYDSKAFIGCKSKNFLSPNQSLITLERLYQAFYNASLADAIAERPNIEDKINFVVDFVVHTTGLSDFGKYLTMLLEVDALFFNEDRHTNNIAVVFDQNSETYGYCPIFDNGLSLFSDTEIDFPLSKEVYRCMEEIEAKPFFSTFEEQTEVAEALFGNQLSFWFNVNDVKELLIKAAEFYPKDVLDRVDDTLHEQLRRFTYLQCDEPVSDAPYFTLPQQNDLDFDDFER